MDEELIRHLIRTQIERGVEILSKNLQFKITNLENKLNLQKTHLEALKKTLHQTSYDLS